MTSGHFSDKIRSIKKYMLKLVFIGLLLPTTVKKVGAQDFFVDSQHAIAVVYDTGKILYENNGNQKAPIA
ncbi:hypothetical protein NC01_09775 [Streptococcus uberis]|nr:hypothetical protein NC01_09775 [Streptococcus uberis]